MFFGRNDAKAETPILWPAHVKSWLIGKDSDAGRVWGQEEKGTTGWDGWMASPTRWMWVWVNSGSWWWTGRPGVLQFMGSQRVRHDWATELNWTEPLERYLLSQQIPPSYCLSLFYFWDMWQAPGLRMPNGYKHTSVFRLSLWNCTKWASGSCCLVTKSCLTLLWTHGL